MVCCNVPPHDRAWVTAIEALAKFQPHMNADVYDAHTFIPVLSQCCP